MGDTINKFDPLDLTLPSIPPRTKLYPLEPIGTDTWYVESLTSYIVRLARAHCVWPRTLILQEILPLLKISDKLKQENRLAWLKGTTCLNGMTPLVEEWVQALEQLTCCNSLRFLTMLPWSDIADQNGIGRRMRAWCPLCYNEWMQEGQEIYEPLIWMLRVIVKCPKHQCDLLHQCPQQDCQKPLPLLDGWSEPGCCPNCGCFLGSSTPGKNMSQTSSGGDERKWNRWVSSAVGELLASSPYLEKPRRNAVASGITFYMERTKGSSVEALARYLGVGASELRSWQKGLHAPRFSTLLRMCYQIDVSPLAFVTQSVDIAAQNRLNTGFMKHTASVPDEELLRYLEIISRNENFPFISLQEAAKRLNLPAQVLQYKFPEICEAITQKYQEQLNANIQREYLEKVLIEDELKSLSLNEVSRRLGCRTTLLKYRFPELCSKIAQQRKKHLNMPNLRLSLHEITISDEEPSPSIHEIACRLGCSTSTLYLRFSEECHAISQKRREWLASQKATKTMTKSPGSFQHTSIKEKISSTRNNDSNRTEEDITEINSNTISLVENKQNGYRSQSRKFVDIAKLQKDLEMLLESQEEIFPTITEVAKKLGYSKSILYRYFPEICHAIVKRSRGIPSIDEVQQMLKAILISQEHPFPSFQEVCKRIGYPETSLRRHFPELCQEIMYRRKYGVIHKDSVSLFQYEKYTSKEKKNQLKEPGELSRLQKTLEATLNDKNCPSVVEMAQTLQCSASSLYHYFPTLCRSIAERHRQQKSSELEQLKGALEEILSCTEEPFPSMQEVAKRLRHSDSVLYNHFPDLCHAIAKRRIPDLPYLESSLDAVLKSTDPVPSVNEVARKLGCSAAALRYYFPEYCKIIKERHKRIDELDMQRQALEAASSQQLSISVNEVARNLGCSSSVLYARFPELCRVITERRWNLTDRDKLRKDLESVLAEEPPPPVQDVAKRLGSPAKNIEYYYPNLCKAITQRHKGFTHLDDLQKALTAFLASEDSPSLEDVARQLEVSRNSLRQRFPELSKLISKKYKHRRARVHSARVQSICEEIKNAVLQLHSQGIYPNKRRVEKIISTPARFKMPEAREAFSEIMKDLGYKM